MRRPSARNPPCRCTLADSSHEWTPGFLLLIPVRGRAGGLIFPLGQAGGQSRSKAKKKACHEEDEVTEFFFTGWNEYDLSLAESPLK